MHGRMQGLHASVQHFRHPGNVRDAGHRHSGRFEGPGRPPGGDDVVTSGRERPGKLDDPTLVEDAEEGSWHGCWRISWCGTAYRNLLMAVALCLRGRGGRVDGMSELRYHAGGAGGSR